MTEQIGRNWRHRSRVCRTLASLQIVAACVGLAAALAPARCGAVLGRTQTETDHHALVRGNCAEGGQCTDQLAETKGIVECELAADLKAAQSTEGSAPGLDTGQGPGQLDNKTPEIPGVFTAYNDLGWTLRELTNKITLYDGVSNTTGRLVDNKTGDTLPVRVAITNSGVTNLKTKSLEDDNPAPNSDAARVFGGIVDCDSYTAWDQGTLWLNLTGLVPSNRYTFVLYGNRGQPNYTSRWTDVTILGASNFCNCSSTGAIVRTVVEPNDTTRLTAANHKGLIWRYIGIAPSPGGEIGFKLSGNGVGSYINAFKLEGYPNLDEDKDGLPDWWEREFFGDLRYGPGDDPDQDGLINSAEFTDGTNPTLTDANSMPDNY